MARKNKVGIDYFSFDVHFYNNDKIQLIEAEFGIKGGYLITRLLCKIYDEGYFYKWGHDQRLLLAKNIGSEFTPDLVQQIVDALIDRSFFDADMYRKYNILTSAGIQRRYLDATNRYSEVKLIKEYMLIDIPQRDNVSIISINADTNLINVNINSSQSEFKEINDSINSQKKIKEKEIKLDIKEEEIKEEERPKIKKPSKAQTEKRFVPPSLEEVEKYVLEKNYKNVDAQNFINYYESVGWFVGKKKMVNWRAAVAGWEARSSEYSPPKKRQPAVDQYDVNEIWKEQIEQAALKRKYPEA